MWDLWWTQWNRGKDSLSTSVFPCQYHSTIAPYSFIHLPPTLYNVFLPVLQFFPVSIIPPMLRTHSFNHPWRYTTIAASLNKTLNEEWSFCYDLLEYATFVLDMRSINRFKLAAYTVYWRKSCTNTVRGPQHISTRFEPVSYRFRSRGTPIPAASVQCWSTQFCLPLICGCLSVCLSVCLYVRWTVNN